MLQALGIHPYGPTFDSHGFQALDSFPRYVFFFAGSRATQAAPGPLSGSAFGKPLYSQWKRYLGGGASEAFLHLLIEFRADPLLLEARDAWSDAVDTDLASNCSSRHLEFLHPCRLIPVLCNPGLPIPLRHQKLEQVHRSQPQSASGRLPLASQAYW